MNYESFIEEVKGNIKDYLPEEFKNAKLQVNKINKNNGIEKQGLVITDGESRISPTIYMEEFYDMYQNGYDMKECMEAIGNLAIKSLKDKPDSELDMNKMFDKETIYPTVINAKANEKLLNTVPHIMINDLAVVFRQKLDMGNEHASYLIKYDHMEKFGMNTGQMMQQAQENVLNEGYTFQSLNDIVMEMMSKEMGDMDIEEVRAMMGEPDDELKMYVLSNIDKVNGAGVIACPEIMEQVSEKLGGDFTILPSSVHELIIVPDASMEKGQSPDELNSMVESVNEEAVGVEERLSNHVYRYDSQNKTINMCVSEPVKDMNISK